MLQQELLSFASRWILHLGLALAVLDAKPSALETRVTMIRPSAWRWTGEVVTVMILSSITSGTFAGKTVVVSCGIYDDFAELGLGAAFYMLPGEDDNTISIDNFAHKGCSG